MRHVQMHAEIGDYTVEEVYQKLCNFACYKDHCEAVTNVKVRSLGNDRFITEWEVLFRDGILKWSEEDHCDAENKTISFDQIKGDIEMFRGQWQVIAPQDRVVVKFSASFDMGIPSLNDLIEPIAAQVLLENTASIVAGLFAGKVKLLPSEDFSYKRT